MIAADVLEKLKGFAISKRDRNLIYGALVFCGVGIAYILGRGQDTKLFQDAISNLIWAGVVLVIVFVAGSVEQRRVAARTMTPQAPPSTATATATIEAEKK